MGFKFLCHPSSLCLSEMFLGRVGLGNAKPEGSHCHLTSTCSLYYAENLSLIPHLPVEFGVVRKCIKLLGKEITSLFLSFSFFQLKVLLQ